MRVWREGVTDSRSAVPRISHAQGKRNHVIKTPLLVTSSLSYQMTVTNHCIAALFAIRNIETSLIWKRKQRQRYISDTVHDRKLETVETANISGLDPHFVRNNFILTSKRRTLLVFKDNASVAPG